MNEGRERSASTRCRTEYLRLLKELVADLHSYYNALRCLVDDEGIRWARLALVAAVVQVIRNGLGLFGFVPEKM